MRCVCGALGGLGCTRIHAPLVITASRVDIRIMTYSGKLGYIACSVECTCMFFNLQYSLFFTLHHNVSLLVTKYACHRCICMGPASCDMQHILVVVVHH